MNRTHAIALSLAASVSLAGVARADDRAAATAAAVKAADIAFDQRAQQVGAAQAFRETMDEADGLQFGAGAPTRGAAAIYKAMGGDAPSKAKLEWAPTEAWGSSGGDMGVTTGTFRFTAPSPGPSFAGHYVTVWRKNAAGAWKGLIDIGNPDPK